nr:hypothetical protein [Tanacetum cinerariifolium]
MRQSKETEEINLTHDTEVLEKGGSNEELVNASTNNTVVPEVSTVNISTASRPKAYKIGLTLQPLPKIDPKDKGKGVPKEEPKLAKKLKKSDLDAAQLAMDKKVAKEYDEIQAIINKDSIVATRLQEEEREKFTVEERAKFLHDTIVAQSNYKHAQLNRKNFKEIQVLYGRQKKSVQDFIPIGSAEDKRRIEEMNNKEVGEDTSMKEKVLEEPNSIRVEVKQEEVKESTRKRLGTKLKMNVRKKARKQTHNDSDDEHNFEEDTSKKRKRGPRIKRMSKRKKTDSDFEEEKDLKTFLKIVPYEKGIINYKVQEKRFPIIN